MGEPQHFAATSFFGPVMSLVLISSMKKWMLGRKRFFNCSRKPLKKFIEHLLNWEANACFVFVGNLAKKSSSLCMCDLLLTFIIFFLAPCRLWSYKKDKLNVLRNNMKKVFSATMSRIVDHMNFVTHKKLSTLTENKNNSGIINCVMLAFDFWFKQNVISSIPVWDYK